MVATKTYEGMFVLDTAAKPWEGLQEELRQLLARHGAEILRMEKWAERKLAYPIAKRKRGTYCLVFFRIPGAAIVPLARDCELSETVLRHLVLDCPNWEKVRVSPPPEESEGRERPRVERELVPGTGA